MCDSRGEFDRKAALGTCFLFGSLPHRSSGRYERLGHSSRLRLGLLNASLGEFERNAALGALFLLASPPHLLNGR